MFENKYTPIFRSRWRALWWASGVLLLAYCTVPSEDGGDPALDMAEAAAGAIGEARGREAPPEHVNPWALDPAGQD